MQFNDKTRKVIFVVIYTMITAILIINAVKYNILIDILYSIIFTLIYIRTIYTMIFN